MWRCTVWHKITHVLEKPPASIFREEVEGNSFLRNVGKFLKDYMASCPRRQLPPREPQISLSTYETVQSTLIPPSSLEDDRPTFPRRVKAEQIRSVATEYVDEARSTRPRYTKQ
jgi:hypothetical protein